MSLFLTYMLEKDLIRCWSKLKGVNCHLYCKLVSIVTTFSSPSFCFFPHILLLLSSPLFCVADVWEWHLSFITLQADGFSVRSHFNSFLLLSIAFCAFYWFPCFILVSMLSIGFSGFLNSETLGCYGFYYLLFYWFQLILLVSLYFYGFNDFLWVSIGC